MSPSKLVASVVSVLLVASAFGSVATAATSNQQQAYAGTHVSFDTTSNAVIDYAVDGETMLESVQVQSKDQVQSRDGVSIGVELGAVTDISGAGVTVESTSETRAGMTTESGAQVDAHDNARGVLVVRAGEDSQYVTLDMSGSSQADAEGDNTVVVTTEDGTQGVFIVVGDGEVAVNDHGNVTADLGSDSQLVFRSYADERTDEDEQHEQFIADGTAAAEVYVIQQGAGSGEAVADVVQYSADTTVEVTQRSEGTVTMTAERAERQGKIIITSVSDTVMSSTDDMQVTVDGEAAARASSYSELRSAIDNGDSSKFLVRQHSDAEASADVLVAVNHFSEREITMTAGDRAGPSDGDPATADDGASTSTSLPGFGVDVALVAIAIAAVLALRRG